MKMNKYTKRQLGTLEGKMSVTFAEDFAITNEKLTNSHNKVNDMKNLTFMAHIEKDEESGMYVGIVPTLKGAHTFAETLDELNIKLKEVISLCLEEMNNEEIKSLITFAGLSTN
jgi:predicted RNase H-like HicB family nuclease